MTFTLTYDDLRQFTGTTIWYKHPMVRTVTYTEGVQYMAERAGAYWLIDEIAFSQLDVTFAKETFQLWKLTVDDTQSACLTCDDGDGNLISEKIIEYTDFPLPEIKLYFTNNVILLPSEY